MKSTAVAVIFIYLFLGSVLTIVDLIACFPFTHFPLSLCFATMSRGISRLVYKKLRLHL